MPEAARKARGFPGLLLLFATSFLATLWWTSGAVRSVGSLAGLMGQASMAGATGAPSARGPATRVAGAESMPVGETPAAAVVLPTVSAEQQAYFEPVIDDAVVGDDPAGRQHAIRALAAAPTAMAVSALVEVLRISTDAGDRAAALWSLRQHDVSPERHALILMSLKQAASDSDPQLASAAANALEEYTAS